MTSLPVYGTADAGRGETVAPVALVAPQAMYADESRTGADASSAAADSS